MQAAWREVVTKLRIKQLRVLVDNLAHSNTYYLVEYGPSLARALRALLREHGASRRVIEGLRRELEDWKKYAQLGDEL